MAEKGTYNFEKKPKLEIKIESPYKKTTKSHKPSNPYKVTVYAPSNTGGLVRLFGYNIFSQDSTQGSDSGIIIQPASGVPYLQLLSQSNSMPFETSLIRIYGRGIDANLQVLQSLIVWKTDSNGQLIKDPILAATYMSSMQKAGNLIDIPHNITIDGNVYIEFYLLANASVEIDFFPLSKLKPSKILVGKEQLQQYAIPDVPVVGMRAVVEVKKEKKKHTYTFDQEK